MLIEICIPLDQCSPNLGPQAGSSVWITPSLHSVVAPLRFQADLVSGVLQAVMSDWTSYCTAFWDARQ